MCVCVCVCVCARTRAYTHTRARASASKYTHHEDYCFRNNEITAARVNGTIRLVLCLTELTNWRHVTWI